MQQSNSRQPYKLTATASSVACANRDTHGVYTCVPRSAHARVAKTLLQRASKVGARAMTHASNRLQAHPNAWPFESGWATDATSVQPGCTAAPARRPHASATTRPSDRPPANDTQPTGSERHAARDASDSDARDRPEQRAISWWRPSEPTTGVTAASDRRPSRAAEGNCGRLWASAHHATSFRQLPASRKGNGSIGHHYEARPLQLTTPKGGAARSKPRCVPNPLLLFRVAASYICRRILEN